MCGGMNFEPKSRTIVCPCGYVGEAVAKLNSGIFDIEGAKTVDVDVRPKFDVVTEQYNGAASVFNTCVDVDVRWARMPYHKNVKDPVRIQGRDTLRTIQRVETDMDVFSYECPECENTLLEGNTLYLDHFYGKYQVEKEWPDGNTYMKDIRTVNMEFRSKAIGRISEYRWTLTSWGIHNELMRILGIDYPEPDPNSKYSAKAQRKYWRKATLHNMQYALTDVYAALKASGAEDWKTTWKLIIKAFRIKKTPEEMSKKRYIFREAWTKVCFKRLDNIKKWLAKYTKRTTIGSVMKSIQEKHPEKVEAFARLEALEHMCPGAYIRSDILRMMKTTVFEIKDGWLSGTMFTPKKAKEWWESEPMLKHEFDDGHYCMDRGRLVTSKDDGSVWYYEPNLKMWRWMSQSDDFAREVSYVDDYGSLYYDDGGDDDAWRANALADLDPHASQEISTDTINEEEGE